MSFTFPEFRWQRELGWLLVLALFAVPAIAQETAPVSPQNQAAEGNVSQSAAATLEKAVQNPVASLISVPLQDNTGFGLGPYNRTQNSLNIQPVVPFNLNENWMVVARIIQPVVWQPYPNQTTGGEYGFGDMVPTFFLSPRKAGKLIWGFGPAFTIPTATDTILGQGKLSMGPSAVALTQPGHWTIGALVNNVWSVAGSGSRPAVNQMLLQYFISYQLKKGWYISSSPILTANWRAANGNVWTAPFGGGFGRVMRLGFQPVSLSAQFFRNAVYPHGGSPWSMRLQISFLFPKLTKEQQKRMMEQRLKQIEQEKPQPPTL